jgi:hypothetical protein
MTMTLNEFRKHLERMDGMAGHEVPMFENDVRKLSSKRYYYCFDALVGVVVHFGKDFVAVGVDVNPDDRITWTHIYSTIEEWMENEVKMIQPPELEAEA